MRVNVEVNILEALSEDQDPFYVREGIIELLDILSEKYTGDPIDLWEILIQYVELSLESYFIDDMTEDEIENFLEYESPNFPYTADFLSKMIKERADNERVSVELATLLDLVEGSGDGEDEDEEPRYYRLTEQATVYNLLQLLRELQFTVSPDSQEMQEVCDSQVRRGVLEEVDEEGFTL
jgi:hypothetical protein